jgi:phytoene dehydrogenase-like protein
MHDVAVVGSGHNGLIAAAYLAKAGCKVAVFERRPIVGGAVCTQDDIIPGYKIDVGSSAHVMIHQTPVLADLELARFGLEYLEMDPWAWHPLAGTNESISFYRDVRRTCDSIAKVSPRDADAYEKFCDAWGELNEGVFAAFLRPPTPWNLVRSLFGRTLRGHDRTNMLRLLLAPYGQLVEETFEHEALRTAIIWLAAQSGPPPSEAASGDFAGWHSMYHRSGMKRARGGSGALTQALKKRILADGGDVFENAPVAAIETDGRGRARGVRLENGERYEARAVIAACHIKTTLDKLLAGAADLPARVRERSASLRLGNGFGMIVRCAMSGLPEYPGQRLDARGVGECHQGLQLLCPSRHAMADAYGDWSAGRPPAKPVPLVMTFSALDDTLAPPGRHVMFVWGQYHAYELRNGENWDAIAEREADKLLDAVEDYAPGSRAKVLDRYIQTPLSIERLHDMHRGNVMHLEMSLDQMFTFRPMPELSSYRVPGIRGLYLTGASTHPGGGVWGASGHNVAQLMLRERRKWA